MEIIKNVVREIAGIVLIASFLEMLLPKSNMKRFVQVILGLFILISILNPIAGLITSKEIDWQIEAWQYQPESNNQLAEIIAQGENIANNRDNWVLRDYESRIEKQIDSLVRLVPGVHNVSVAVKVGSQSSSAFGEIQQVAINILEKPPEESNGNQSERMDGVRLEEVVINLQDIEIIGSEKENGKIQPASATADLRLTEVTSLISNFYSLPAEKIEVTVQH